MPVDDNATSTQGLQRLVVRPPPFSAERPALWFAQLEGQFRLANVTEETDKFDLASVHLSTEAAAEVQDIILHPPLITPYKKLKEALVERLTLSQEARLHQLLDREILGDRKPSQFLRHLRSLVDNIPENILKTKWLSRLPETTQSILATQPDASLEKLAALADKLLEISSPPNVNAVQTSPDPAVTALEARFSRLEACISELAGAIREERSRSRSRSRSSSRSRGIYKDGKCWYHYKHAEKANKCSAPTCSMKNSGNLPSDR